MTAWWWIILCIGICAGQTPVLTPASGTSAKYKENKSLTCNYSTFVATDDFQLLQNSSIIYSNIGPAAGKESKYDINIQNGMVKLIIKNVDLSDIGDYVCNMDLTNSLSVKISVWSKPVVLIDHNDGIAVVTARGIYPHESNIINFEAEINNVKVTFPDGVVTRNAMDSNLFDIVWTAKKELDSVNPVVYVSFNIYGNFWNETQALNYDPDRCKWYEWMAGALFVCVVLLTIVSIIVYASAENCCVALTVLIIIMIIMLILIHVWTMVIVLYLIECTGEPSWCIGLAVSSLCISTVSVAVMITVLICSSGRKVAKLFRKLFYFDLDEKEFVDLAAVLVVIHLVPWTLGLILVVPGYCDKKGRFAEVVEMFWCHKVGFKP